MFQSLLFWNSVCELVASIIPRLFYVVSILVVLEFGLWAKILEESMTTYWSFNPCCFGIRSVSFGFPVIVPAGSEFQSLLFWNSVCESRILSRIRGYRRVSILVVLEFGLWAGCQIHHINVYWRFQSLLFWNSVCEQLRHRTLLFCLGFQSLLFWNSVCETTTAAPATTKKTVSILVVLEFGLWGKNWSSLI